VIRRISTVTVSTLLACAAFSAPRPSSPPNPQPTAVKIISAPSQPMEVKIVEVPPKTEAVGEQESRLAHEANEQGLTEYTQILAKATIVLVAVAAVQALLFLWQLLYMKRSLQDALISANAARDGALAATQSVAIAKLSMVAGNRAYVHYNGCRWISHRHSFGGRLFWRVRPMWTNTGETPTRKLIVVVGHEISDLPIGDNFEFIAERHNLPAMIAAHGVIESEPFDVPAAVMEEVQAGKKHLYVWGVAWYRDVFPESPERITKFCVEATNLTGDPKLEWHKDKNPFDIQFITYKRHNCTDDEC
jgi:hypothetical protein